MHTRLIIDRHCHLPAGLLHSDDLELLSDPNDFRSRLHEHWLYQSDALLALCPPAHFADSLADWRNTLDTDHRHFEPLRRAAQLTYPFRARLFASSQLYAGLGLVAVTALRLLKSGLAVDAVQAELSGTERRITHRMAVPILRRRQLALPLTQRWKPGRHGGVLEFDNGQARRFTAMTSALVSLLEQALEPARLGGDINLSYAGPLEQLIRNEYLQQLQRTATANGGHCWLSRMDPESEQRWGSGTLSLAWLSAPARLETP